MPSFSGRQEKSKVVGSGLGGGGLQGFGNNGKDNGNNDILGLYRVQGFGGQACSKKSV